MDLTGKTVAATGAASGMGPFFADGIFRCVAERDALSTPYQPLLSEAKDLISLLC